MDRDEKILRSRLSNRSQNSSAEHSRKSSRSSSRGHSATMLNTEEMKNNVPQIRGTKSPKSVRKPRMKSSSASSKGPDASNYATPEGTDYESNSEIGGLHQPLANLQYALHTALSDKSEEQKGIADQLLKADSNKKLRESLKLERVRVAQIFATLFDESYIVPNSDIPRVQPFNSKKAPCSQDEFERQFRGIIRNFPRFEGKCFEFLYFLMELAALRSDLNVTDDQLVRILQNRLTGRLRQYFMAEIKREKNAAQILNDLGPKYAETVDRSAEIEKCANFKFHFKNVERELIELKEIMSLAYPHLPIELLRESYIQKVIDKLPSETRFQAYEVFELQREREKKGFKPLKDHQITEKFIHLCKHLESKNRKEAIHKVYYSGVDIFNEDD
jgi:hypothetical protein